MYALSRISVKVTHSFLFFALALKSRGTRRIAVDMLCQAC